MAQPRSEQFVLELTTQETVDLVLAPALNYSNPLLGGMTGLYKVLPAVKGKAKMLHLHKPKNNLQPKLPCSKWNPNINFKTTSNEIDTCSFEVNGEQCGDEFDQGCLRNLQAAGSMVNDMGASAQLDAIMGAMVLTLREGISDDVYKTAWFGDTRFGTDEYAGFIDLSKMQCPEDKDKATAMLTHCEGWWAELIARTAETDPNRTVRAVDTNDGTAAGNATNPANILGFLQELVFIKSDPLLQYWGRGANEMGAVILLQRELFRAYVQYLQSAGCQNDCMLVVNGTPIQNVYTYEGYPVMEVPEWTMFDLEFGGMDANGVSRNARAVFTARENLCIATDTDELTGFADAGLLIEKSPLLRDKGKYEMYAGYKFGFGIAHPRLITIGYNSSDVFV